MQVPSQDQDSDLDLSPPILSEFDLVVVVKGTTRLFFTRRSGLASPILPRQRHYPLFWRIRVLKIPPHSTSAIQCDMYRLSWCRRPSLLHHQLTFASILRPCALLLLCIYIRHAYYISSLTSLCIFALLRVGQPCPKFGTSACLRDQSRRPLRYGVGSCCS